MKCFLESLAALIKVKTIVTFAVTSVFVFLAVTGAISSETAMSVVIMVVSFYFGIQHEQGNGGAGR